MGEGGANRWRRARASRLRPLLRHMLLRSELKPVPVVRKRNSDSGEMAGVQLHRESFSCSICLDLLKDPVALTCGHSFCMNCIKDHWDSEDEKRSYSCPQCRKSFTPRPELLKNIMLADLVEELKKTELHAAPADHCYAGAEDVACDVCTGRKLKALKLCLVCLASYCEEHLQPHHQSPAFKTHKLVEPFKNLQENICSRHGKMMDIFCRTDQQCICYLCSVEQHKDHDTVSAAAERMQKQKRLDLSQEEVQHRLQEIDRDMKVLQQQEEALTVSADKAVDDTDKIFTELSSEVKHQIRSKQQTEVSRVRDTEKQLQQEKTELKKREAELKQLSLTQDHSQFLLNYRSLSALSPSTHSSTINVCPLRHFEDLTAAVAKLRGQLQDVLTEMWSNISLAVDEVEPEPKTRAEFFIYSQEIKLDPNTVNKRLFLSEGNRKVTKMKKDQSYPDHTDRFIDWPEVLSKESLSGCCYWEVERTGAGVHVAVTYKNISRSGRANECVFGFNDKSWALYCFQYGCRYRHNNIWTKVSHVKVSRVGVFRDHRAGLLSFYSVSDTMTLIHRVHITFTQPLYAGVGFYYSSPGDTAEFCKLK